MALNFEWDARNTAVFADPFGRIMRDSRHSVDEERYVLLGVSLRRKLLAVMYMERGDTIRLISARPATRRERRDYEEPKQ